MAFRVEKTKVSEFEPDAANSALRFTFEIQGHFGKNAKVGAIIIDILSINLL